MLCSIVYSFLSCFAAGVFLGTCLLDLYPEVEEKLNKAVKQYISEDNPYKDYPFAEAIMVAGFFLVLIVEQVVLAIKEGPSTDNALQVFDTPSNSNGTGTNSKKPTYDAMGSTEVDPLLERSVDYEVRSRSASTSSARSLNTISNVPVNTSSQDFEASMHHDQSSHSPIRSFIMLAALSIHSVFEGLAVGLQDTTAQVLSIFGALILHKCIIAFSIGLNLVQSKLSVKTIFSSNAIFCVASPVGIAIGIIVLKYSSGDASALANGLLQGIACGTFLYVTFFEVLPHEFNQPKDRILKLLFVLIGFAFVNGVLFLEMYSTQGS